MKRTLPPSMMPLIGEDGFWAVGSDMGEWSDRAVSQRLTAMREDLPTIDTNTQRLDEEALRIQVTIVRSDHRLWLTSSAAIPPDGETIRIPRGTCRRRCRC